MQTLELATRTTTQRRFASGFKVCAALSVWTAVVTGLTSPQLVLADGWKAAAAKVNITPKKAIWMSGYGSRTSPAKGKLTDLWAKALVIEDPAGERVVLVTLDLVGIPRPTSLEVRRTLHDRHGFKRKQVALFTSHTHTGPVVSRNLAAMYFFGEDQWRSIDEYEAELKKNIVDVVGAAVQQLTPAELTWGIGRATFAVNRRENRPESSVPELRKAGQLKGPVDHDVPVLKVTTDGKLAAVVFGYACHATVLSFMNWSGDYPGFAQIEVEKAHPGAVALFWAGCGADQNPLPRRKVELAQQYGKRLATAVDAVLEGTMQPVTGGLGTEYEEIDLSFAKLPTRRQIEENTKSSNRYEARRAKLLLERLDRDGKLSQTYPYPVQTWRLGSKLLFVTLGGEVVVDYSLRLKRELGLDSTWVAGYTNDVMAYIPSLRVLREGGYEGATSMIYYGQPTVWAEDVEEMIVRTVLKQARQLRKSAR